MTVQEFLAKYKAFVIDAGFTVNSADQYMSYIKNACKKLVGVEKNLELIAASEDIDVRAAYAEQINAAITQALKSGNSIVSQKRLRDYKSAVNVLIAFLSGDGWEKSQGSIAKPKLSCASEYTQKDLKRIFLSRLKTQDRFSYSYGVFAARVLCKIATANNVKLFDKMADNVKFIYSKNSSDFFVLKDIDKLIIATDGFAYIERKGVTYPVYTAAYKQGNFIGYEKAAITLARYLSLDHDVPMVEALEKELPNMTEYKKLSDDMMKYKQSYKGNASQLSIEYYNSAYKKLSVCETELLKEMSAFLDSLQLTIMHSSYNSSKNKN